MKKMMLKFVALIVLLVAIQSCSKENDLPIINEENKIRQAEKLTSTIRVFAVNDSFLPYTVGGSKGVYNFSFDGDSITDLAIRGRFCFVLSCTPAHIESNMGVLKYKTKGAPFRLAYGQNQPVNGVKYSRSGQDVYFANLSNFQTYYIGFKVKYITDQQVHFGWVKVKQKTNTGGFIYEVAINDAPNTPVFAGEI